MATKEQAEHVERIARFLQEGLDHCEECPYGNNFDYCKNYCLDFLGLDYYVVGSDIQCPCKQLGKKAIDRVWQAIVDFDLQRHKWNREEGE